MPIEAKPAPRRNIADLLFSGLTGLASFTVIVLILGSWRRSCGILACCPEVRLLPVPIHRGVEPVKQVFGAASTVYGTMVTTLLALLIAIPTAVGIAIFVTEIAPNFLKGPIGAAIELLAAIPSIIYGMWGLFTLAPLMAKYIEPALKRSLGNLPLLEVLFRGTPMGIDLLTASVILAIMIIPFTASISRDAST